MTEPREIYLQPACCADPNVGRLWCEHDEPVECEEGVPWSRYVRGDVVYDLEKRIAELEKDKARLEWLVLSDKTIELHLDEYVALDVDGELFTAWHKDWREAIDVAMGGGDE